MTKWEKLAEFARQEARRHLGAAALLALCSGTYALVGWLAGAPLPALAYGGLLCLCAALAVLGWDARCAWQRCCELERLAANLPASIAQLPPPTGAEQAAQQELLRRLAAQNAALESENAAGRRQMTDYYTLWAHQIKTPIAAMQLLLQTDGGENAPELAAELFKIEQYVELVLQYLRSQDMAGDLAVGRAELEPLVKGAVRKYAKLFILKRIDLVLGPLDGTALTDEKWLAFCLEQLLSNALKYTPGGGKVSIELAPGPRKVLVIRDTGCGIAAEDLPRVMERGFTGYNGRENKKSTGSGLYLCKKVLANLGHRFWLESAPGKGTAAMIDLTEARLGVE